jgi:proteasome lid subunit RPN8/RPN11
VISLDPLSARRVREEGEKAYPGECCGFLLGRVKEAGSFAEELIPVSNAREAEEQYHRFVMEPEDFMRAEREAGRRNLDILGVYHSHPDHPALPSDYDREHALPFYSYIIVSVKGEGGKPKAGPIKSWKLAEDRSVFYEEEIEWR